MEASHADCADARADRIHRAWQNPRGPGGARRRGRPPVREPTSSAQRSASARSTWRFSWPNWKRSLVSIHLPSSFRSPASDRWRTSCGPINRRSFRSSSAADEDDAIAAAVEASPHQASAEGAEMTGGNSSAGVAIVGIACRFPGAADHPAFWQNLCEGVELISCAERRGSPVGGRTCRAVARSVLREGRLVAAGHRPVRCRLLRIFAGGSAAHGSAAAAAAGGGVGGLRGRRATRRAARPSRSAFSPDWAGW